MIQIQLVVARHDDDEVCVCVKCLLVLSVGSKLLCIRMKLPYVTQSGYEYDYVYEYQV